MASRFDPIITASIVAKEGHGKTEFLWSLPTPCSVFHIDPNTEEAFENAVERGQIERDDFTLHQIEYPTSILGRRNDIQDLAEKELETKFLMPLQEALDTDAIRSIGIDTATEIFELHLMADHGKTVQILPEMRTKTNYKYKGLLRAIQRSKKHCILLHRARTRFENREVRTQQGVEERREAVDGVYEREGFSRTGFHVNVEAFLIHDPTHGEKLVQQFGMRVGRCTSRPSLKTADPETKDFWNLDDPAWWFGHEKQEDGSRVRRVSFSYLATQVYPATSLDDWK